VILLLAGCQGLGLDPVAAVSENGLAISLVDPAWGYPDEETPITIKGQGFGYGLVANLGNSALSLTVINDTTLTAVAPAPGFPATADLELTLDGARAVLPDAFEWREDAPEDEAGDDEEEDGGGDDDDAGDDDDDQPDTSGRGKTGGLVQMSYMVYGCPDCWGATSNLEVAGVAVLHKATSKSWVDWIPSEGDCAENPSVADAASTFWDAGERAELVSGSQAWSLRAASDNVFQSQGLGQDDWTRTAAWDFEVDGGSDIAGFTVRDAIETPQSFSTIEPAEIAGDGRQAFSARLSTNNAAFSWSPTGGSGSMIVDLQFIDPWSSSWLGQVVCRGPDNGSLRVPSSYLQAYRGAYMGIALYRFEVGGFERPDDASTVETEVMYGLYGTGVLQ
jgi:hypothetical protein